MATSLDSIKTIVIVMMENRSFDHLLGYLSAPPFKWNNVDGIRSESAWLDSVASVYQGSKYRPFLCSDPYSLMDAEPPHERNEIALQMGVHTNNKFPMDGFVTNYAKAK